MAVVFDSTEKRFKQKGMQSFYHAGSTAPILGPGSYVNTVNSLVKKSFNMSMEHSYFVWAAHIIQFAEISYFT